MPRPGRITVTFGPLINSDPAAAGDWHEIVCLRDATRNLIAHNVKEPLLTKPQGNALHLSWLQRSMSRVLSELAGAGAKTGLAAANCSVVSGPILLRRRLDAS